MSSLDEMLRDNGAFSASKTQAHLTLLRMFCSVYDALGAHHPLAQAITVAFAPQSHTPEQIQTRIDQYLSIVHYRYTLYLDLLVAESNTPKETWPLPPWDVALMMHTHLLSPVRFANDISRNSRYSKLAGKVDFPLLRLLNKLQNIDRNDVETASKARWQAKFSFPYDLIMIQHQMRDNSFPPRLKQLPWLFPSPQYNPKKFRFNPSNPFSLDLTQAVKRQIAFARKITAMYPYDPVPDALILDSEQRYAKFMNLIRLNATPNPVPAMDIDLFWHTHQLSSSNYLPWCTHHVGRPINHDDTVAEGVLSTGLDETIAAWGENYFEDYLNPPLPDIPVQPVQNPPTVVQQQQQPRLPRPETYPPGSGNPPPGSFPGLTTAHRIPPPGLTPAQLKLWHFDVACQNDHEGRAMSVLKLQAEITPIEQQILMINQPRPPPPPPTPAELERGLFSLFIRSAARGVLSGSSSRAQESNRLNDQRSSKVISRDATISSEYTKRERCGRERWPLLCAARGWGDPRVSNGKIKRPPQGTTDLPFPVYAATYYENRGLMYYNYFTGSGVEGGGTRVGGGMCGANFDGGLCKAEIVYSNDYSGMCSGGG